MNFPFYIARRYTVSFSKSTAINIITGIATIGIVVSAMALFVVLSVFSGLRTFSLSFANDTDPDLKVFPTEGKSFFISDAQKNKLAASENIAPTLLATTGDLQTLIERTSTEEGVDIPVLRGWRRKLIGDTLLSLLAGGLQVWIDPDAGKLRYSPRNDPA